MINSRLQCGAIAAVEPPMTFPFIWRGRSGDIYLRVASRAHRTEADVRVIGVNTGPLGATSDTSHVTDGEAWALRLKPSEMVSLTNTA